MSKINILNKFLQLNYYYFLPCTIGVFTGLFLRDSYLLSLDQKLSMALIGYYETIDEEPNKEILKNFPDMKELLKINKSDKHKYDLLDKDSAKVNDNSNNNLNSVSNKELKTI